MPAGTLLWNTGTVLMLKHRNFHFNQFKAMFNTKKAKKMHILLHSPFTYQSTKVCQDQDSKDSIQQDYIVKAHSKKKNTAQRKQGKNSEKLLTPGSLEPAMNGGMIMTHMLG